MGGATRFMTLLTAPFPPLRPSISRLHRCLSSLSATPLRFLTVSSPFKTEIRTPQLVNCFHSQPSNNTYALHSAAAEQPQQHHPWPEWTQFLNILSNSQGFSAPEDYRIPPEDAFVVYEKLPDDFVRAAAACIALARARPDLLGLLSRKDIEAVVSNGTPFLFKSALDTARRMRAFLGTDVSNVSEFDKANTVDLMKYILSYASNPTVSSERNGLYSRELVDSSVRNLLHELATICSGVPTGYVPASVPQFRHRDGQTPRPFGQNIEMKRGDWICLKCNFMNFARNMKCLECEEARPKRQLTGGEWECPQCNFFNYGRNLVCLRCDCRRPGAPLFNNSNSQSSSVYNRDYSNKMNTDNRLVRNEEKARQWFSKISQMNNSTDVNRPASNEDFPEIMPLRKGENQFVSTRKTPFERKLANSQHENNLGNNAIATDSTLDPSINRSLDNILGSGRPSTISERADSGFTPQQNVGTEFSHPVDTFSRRDQTLEIDDGTEVSLEAHESRSVDEKEQDEKSERWFKKMAELHDVKDLPSAISDEDFPEIMPMRKGENRFVASKKKDRSLTSPKYKRQVAMDQANNTNFVPFVPFPPGYFARKNTEQPSGQDTTIKAGSEMSSSKNMTEAEESNDSKNEMAGTGDIPRIQNQPMSSDLQSSAAGSTAQSSITSHPMNGNTSVHAGPAGGGPSSQMLKDENVQSGWTGKSLEGSGVKEPDPLDMSEEAKAERWFKRVAQIKDISELSQIPDEDFPSIMPMRKGVNRFVVSKRKTPLERRLTSQQYRRNLPIVSNDSVKKETDSS